MIYSQIINKFERIYAHGVLNYYFYFIYLLRYKYILHSNLYI